MNSWSSAQLRQAFTRRNVSYACISFPQLTARVGYGPCANIQGVPDSLENFDAFLIRPIGRGSLEEIVFRMDVLYRLARLGFCVVNPPEAIEHCVDKYDILAILEENDVPVPRTAVTENIDSALEAFRELGRDVIVKPLFGSRGIGATRVNDEDVACTIFRSITLYHGVIYLQEFIEHGFQDTRAFVVGDRVVAAMCRVAGGWKTNYSQGARPVSVKLEKSLDDMAVKSARLLECKVAGIDILESEKGAVVVEANSQPGWKGLQSVTSINIADKVAEFVISEARK